MFSKWPIRVKLLVGLSLLVLMVGILSGSGLYTTYAYRALVKSLGWRVGEFPLADEVNDRVSNLQATLGELRGLRAARGSGPGDELAPLRLQTVRERFCAELDDVDGTLAEYRKQVEQKLHAGFGMADNQPERDTVHKIEAALQEIHRIEGDRRWIFDDQRVRRLDDDIRRLHDLTAELSGPLQAKLNGLADEVRGQYRTLIVGTWIAARRRGVVLRLVRAALLSLGVPSAWRF